MEPVQFLRSLQLTDAFFPVGAFAYSDGLETAASGGRVRDAESLASWMRHFLDGVFVPCEGLALVKAVIALEAEDLDTLRRIDEELTIIRPSGAVRAASAGVGKRLLSIFAAVDGRRSLFEALNLPYGNAAVAYAAVFHQCGLDGRSAALAFGYNRLAGIVSAGLRLIAIGQHQGQVLLTQSLDRLPAAVEEIMRMTDEPLRSFNPVLDIEQMNHQFVYSRLFRS
jgi:urease accessory protein